MDIMFSKCFLKLDLKVKDITQIPYPIVGLVKPYIGGLIVLGMAFDCNIIMRRPHLNSLIATIST